ncbi:MAG: MmgE/PrpD family protein [Smithellaceae bacterium]|nr:MmgE/PrpD family protein [Smithellaceae bacterium]
MKKEAGGEIINSLSSYIASTGQATLPAEVIHKAKHHILDTLGAIICGATLKPGQLAKKFVRQQGGAAEALVAGTAIITSAINAAFAMGIMAHSDETDDSHERAGMHPGCGIVPAALAVAERAGADGLRFLKGVVAGYDIGCRITQALGVENVRRRALSLHGIGSNFGAAAASASILGLSEDLLKYVWDYTAQQDSGKYYWMRDRDHVEKAFVFAGMGARNGVTSAILVETGFTGVADAFSGENNYFESFSPGVNPALLVEELGRRYEIQLTDIKKYSVGAPIQAPLEALLNLRERHNLTAAKVEGIIARVPDDRVLIVRDREMPDVDLKHVLAVALLDGGMTFEASHSYERMNDPAVLAIRGKITLVGDPELRTAKIKRGGIVEVTTIDGARLREHVELVRGRPGNPMSDEEIEKKCTDLMIPVLGADKTKNLIEQIWQLEKVKNMRELRPLLSVP